MANFVPLEKANELDALFAASHQRPVLLFKHSLTCPVSADAYREMSLYPGQVELVVVQSARALAEEIESRSGIRHESPQAILLHNGGPVWNASHWKITTEAVSAAVAANQ
ncbi:MAG: bacillithiol system redox-active protein YtxJ [Pyrinomonadaceae bacterium]